MATSPLTASGPIATGDRRIVVFSAREDAEKFCRAEHEAGNMAAFVSTLSSHLMTSDNSPCVVNAL